MHLPLDRHSLRRRGFQTATAVLLLTGQVRLAGGAEVIRIADLDVDEDIRQETFQLSRSLTLHVHCDGAGDGGNEEMFAYGWILDAKSREILWALSPDRARVEEGGRVLYDGDVTLAAGTYVAGFTAFGQWRARQRIIRIGGKEIARIEMDHSKSRRVLRNAKSWGLQLDTKTESDASALVEPPPNPSDPRLIMQLIGEGDEVFDKRGFTLTERTRVTVYCIGEWDGKEGSMADAGFILDAATHKQVWALGPDNFKHAGGVAKNKMARETIPLPPGSYLVYYASDGSHSATGWNAPPPYDPDYWGITLWAESEAAARRAKPYTDDSQTRTILSLDRQGSDAYASQGITVLKPMQVRVYALGEYTEDSGFVDRGWIEEFKSHRHIWDMTPHNTQPAGGAAKNRFADEMITVQPGDYVVYYMTDDTHAFDDWNSSQPHDPEHWGICMYGGPRFDRGSFKLFDAEAREESGQEFLVRLVRVRDDEDVTRSFHLDRPMRVRILALGEGMDPDMADYGWIENRNTGQTVWELTWRNSRWAGGARKNRIFDGQVYLDAGDYRAHFKTDGSHAWGEFNAPPPDDPTLWGLTIMTEGKNP